MTSGPANIEAEQAVLGACLLSREALAAVAGFLEPAHFAEELHRRIFAAMRERLAEGALATLVTLGPLLGDLDLPEGAAAPAYLARLAASAPSIVNAPDYARQIVDLARRRAIMRVARGALDAAASPAIGGPTQAIAADAIDGLNEIVAAGGERRRRPLCESAGDLLAHAEKIRAGTMVSQAATTGFRDLDTATGGYEAGALWIVAARPGVGKTIFQVTSSLKVARAGARSLRETGEGFGALAYSLEVPERQVCARYLSDLCYIPRAPIEYGRIARGEFSDEEAGRLAAAQKTLSRLPLTLDASSKLTLAEIGAGVRAEKAAMARTETRLAVVFVDYLKFIRASDRYKGQRHYEVGEISGGLKQLAKDEGLCIVLLAQLNRALESREDKRPNLSDLRESGDLEADADVVVFLHREAHRILKSPEFRAGSAEAHARYAAVEREAELIVGKNRAGPERTVKLWCLPSCSTMADAARGVVG
jgi:replicative DNA helicase